MTSPDWSELDRLHVWHPYTQAQTAPAPLAVERAEGVYLHVAGGRRILDAISSWWVNIHGHSHPRLNRALAEQAERLQQVIFAGATHEPAARLAAELVRHAPGRLPRVFYSDDGSTAVEVALKMAYQSWRNRGDARRTLFVAFERAYHGDTFGAMAAGGVAAFHDVFRDLFCDVRRARLPFLSAAGESHLPSLEEILEREGDRVAAVIVEPMLQGAGGMIVWPAAALRAVRDATARHGLPLIADEVLTGFGRTGKMFACEHAAVEPDLLCLSKALTGGYLPLAATLATEEIYGAFLAEERNRALFHGHSYTANALACAVALESLRLFDDERRLDRVVELERLFRRRLERLARHPRVEEVRCIGAVAAVELATGGGGYLDDAGPLLQAEFIARGILLRPLGNVLYFMPPYVIQDAEAEWVFDEIEKVLAALPSAK